VEKRPRLGGDRGYWLTCTSHRMVSAWIPLTDVVLEMGPLEVIEGSNQWSFSAEQERGFFDPDRTSRLRELEAAGHKVRVRSLSLKRGQVSFHSSGRTSAWTSKERKKGPCRKRKGLKTRDTRWRRQRHADPGVVIPGSLGVSPVIAGACGFG
jgi:hypothetical protein